MRPIAHATDLGGDDPAFLHACGLAAASRAPLVSIHAEPGPHGPFPATSRFAGWGDAIEHRRICHTCCDDVACTLLDAVRTVEPQLVVCGTHARRGFAALVHESVAATLARNLPVPTLIVPNDSTAFVDAATGAVALGTLLVPAGSFGEAARGIAAARMLAALAGAREVAIELVHTGPPDPALAELGVPIVIAHGTIERAICDTARTRGATLVVMTTHGHDGLRDILFGSHTEHVIREVRIPVLAVRA